MDKSVRQMVEEFEEARFDWRKATQALLAGSERYGMSPNTHGGDSRIALAYLKGILNGGKKS